MSEKSRKYLYSEKKYVIIRQKDKKGDFYKMLNLAVRNTNKIIREKSKKDNVRLGRMFTKKDTARLMAELCEVPHKESVYVLDAGAGTGILSAAIVEKLCSEQDSGIKQIYLTAYETDKELIPMLKDNLERIRKKVRHDYKIKLVNNIVEDNFLVACADAYRDTLFTGAMQKYDIIVTNPPEELVSKDSNEASVYEDVCAKDTEKSALFTALASVMLNENGEYGIPVPDYVDENVSTKVVKIIQSYTRVVDKMVWRKF
jgi:adenine-specific DNA-methyltransferase